jgi:hypothetical protein
MNQTPLFFFSLSKLGVVHTENMFESYYLKKIKRREVMDKDQKEKNLNISGSFQVVDESRREDLDEVKEKYGLDEETLYYARQFMED